MSLKKLISIPVPPWHKIETRFIAEIGGTSFRLIPKPVIVFPVVYDHKSIEYALNEALNLTGVDTAFEKKHRSDQSFLQDASNSYHCMIEVYTARKWEGNASKLFFFRDNVLSPDVKRQAPSTTIRLAKIKDGDNHHYVPLLDIEESFTPSSLMEMGLPTGFGEQDEKKASHTLGRCMPVLHRDAKKHTEYLASELSLQTGSVPDITSDSRAVWVMDCIRFQMRKASLPNITDDELDDLVKLTVIKAVPESIALEGNEIWPWVSDGTSERLALPIIQGNCFSRIDSNTGMRVGSLDDYAVSFAHIDHLESPELFLKNLALSLEKRVKDEGLKGSTLVIHGIPPTSFLFWVNHMGVGKDLQSLEKESPIPNVEIVLAVPLPGARACSSLTEYVFGKFMFRFKSSNAPQKLALNNRRSPGLTQNIYRIWQKIRPFTRIDDVINQTCRIVRNSTTSTSEVFWKQLLDGSSLPARREVPWKKIDETWVLNEVPQIVHQRIRELREICKTGAPDGKKKALNLLKKNNLSAEESDPSHVISAAQTQFRTVIKRNTIFMKAFDGFNLAPGHVIDDVLKGYSYEQSFTKVEEVSSLFLDSQVHYQEHGIQYLYLFEIRGDWLHMVRRQQYLSDESETMGEGQVLQLLTGLASLMGRISAPDLDSVCDKLAETLVRYNKGQLVFRWDGKFEKLAFGEGLKIAVKERNNVKGTIKRLESELKRLNPETSKYQDIVVQIEQAKKDLELAQEQIPKAKAQLAQDKEFALAHFDNKAINGFQSKLIEAVKRKKDPEQSKFDTISEVFDQLLQCEFYENADGVKLSIGEWLEFLSKYSLPTDTLLSDVLADNSVNGAACLSLISKGCSDELREAPDAGLLYFLNAQTTHVEGVVKLIYVVKPNDEVLIEYESIFGDGCRPAHSQLAGGAAVKAAGELVFRKEQGIWYLDEINNGSGHYKPPAPESLPLARDLITARLESTDIAISPGGVKIRNCLFPGMPALS